MFEAEDFWFWSHDMTGVDHMLVEGIFFFFNPHQRDNSDHLSDRHPFARQMDITYLLSRPDHRGRTE